MEPNANGLKGVEALYNLTKAAYDAEIGRYDAAEAKAGRYLTVLGLIIGAFVLKFDDLLWVWNNAPTWAATLFVVAYGLTVFCAMLAFLLSVLAMSISEVSAIPVGEEIERLFREHDYQVAIEATTESFRSEARKLRDTTAERIGYVEKTNRLVKIIMVTGGITLMVYFPLRLRAPNEAQKGDGAKMADTAVPTNTTQTETKPANTAKPPKFEPVKRDAGDVVRRK